MAYRDSLGAVKERVRFLEAEVRDKGRHVGAVTLALVPEQLAKRVDELRPQLDQKPASNLASWLEREAVLSALGSALDEVATLAPDLTTRRSPPRPPDLGVRLPYLARSSRHVRLGRQVRWELADAARRVSRVRWGDHGYVWRFWLDDVGLTLRARAWREVIDLEYVELMLYAAMPSTLGPLSVTTAAWWYGDQTKAILGELDLDDGEFSRHFRVKGSPRLGRALLSAEVQEGLVSLRRHDPRLVLDKGRASLVWHLECAASEEPALGVLAAARALAGLRTPLQALPPAR